MSKFWKNAKAVVAEFVSDSFIIGLVISILGAIFIPELKDIRITWVGMVFGGVIGLLVFSFVTWTTGEIDIAEIIGSTAGYGFGFCLLANMKFGIGFGIGFLTVNCIVKYVLLPTCTKVWSLIRRPKAV